MYIYISTVTVISLALIIALIILALPPRLLEIMAVARLTAPSREQLSRFFYSKALHNMSMFRKELEMNSTHTLFKLNKAHRSYSKKVFF